MKNSFYKIVIFALCVLPSIVLAAGGVGGMANNLMEPVGLMSDFIGSGCILIGASFLFASLIKYIEHRRSPLMVPISTVVFLLIAGIVLLGLPFLYLLTGYGVPYTLVHWHKG